MHRNILKNIKKFLQIVLNLYLNTFCIYLIINECNYCNRKIIELILLLILYNK